MKLKLITPRDNWQQRCESEGLYFHSIDGKYWSEEYYYSFGAKEIDKIKLAAEEIEAMCYDFIDHQCASGDWSQWGFSDKLIDHIINSWKRHKTLTTQQTDTLYGRMDLSFMNGDVKLLEYNADTPATLLESSLIQRTWARDMGFKDQQFNHIDEALLEQMRKLKNTFNINKLFFACTTELEGQSVCQYLLDIACRNNMLAEYLSLDSIGYVQEEKSFVTPNFEIISHLFKFYPWEWVAKDESFEDMLNPTSSSSSPKTLNQFTQSNLELIEPSWKLLLSNKILLAKLWQRFPAHPNLLASSLTLQGLEEEKIKYNIQDKKHVAKKLFGREGQNIAIFDNNTLTELSAGIYSDQEYMYQQYCELPSFDHPSGTRWCMTGAWMVGAKCVGIGCRDDEQRITRDTSWFAPHKIEE